MSIKKIKRIERNNAVYQLVRAWADYLHGEDTLFRSRESERAGRRVVGAAETLKEC